MKPNQEKIQELTTQLEQALKELVSAQETNAELAKEIASQKEINTNLLKEIEQLKAAKAQAAQPARASKSREQALAVAELLKAGPVTTSQLATLNPKYPSDPAYYYLTLLGGKLERAKVSGQSVYFTPEQYAVYTAGLAKEKEAKAAEPAAEAPQAPAPTEAAATVGAAA